MAKLITRRECESCDRRTPHYGRICLNCPDWSIWPERLAGDTPYGIEKADGRDVLRRLSDSWGIDYKIAKAPKPHSLVTRIDAILKVLYCEPIAKARTA